jgi:hypothetical protein
MTVSASCGTIHLLRQEAIRARVRRRRFPSRSLLPPASPNRFSSESSKRFRQSGSRLPTWRAPLGWIGFEGGTPDRSIHLSQAAAEELIHRTPSALDTTIGTHETLLGRALGRALSHELGHYLLQSKAHTPRGLMRADWPSEDFLSVNRSGFQLTHEQLDAAARLLRQETGDQL